MVCVKECVVGLAVAAAAKRWPQPLVFGEQGVELTQEFVDFHKRDAVRGLVLCVKLEVGELFFASRECVRSTTPYRNDLQAYNCLTHLACLIEFKNKVKFSVHPFSNVSKQDALPTDYCDALNECELPCEDTASDEVSIGFGLDTLYDVLLDMKRAGLTMMEVLNLLDPHISTGAINWNSREPLSVRSLDDALLLQSEAMCVINRLRYQKEWTPKLLRSLNITR